MLKQLLFLMATTLTSLVADDLYSQTARLQQKAATIQSKNEITISQDMLERAKSLGYTFESKKPELEKWKDSMSYDEGKVIFNRDKLNITKAEKGMLHSDERIYIFISSSIPKETLIQYARAIDASGLGNNIVMVMRGCIGGCEKIKPTLRFIENILTDGGNIAGGMKAQIWIDPLLFRRYGINKAPVFIYAKGVNTQKAELSEGLENNLKSAPSTYKSEGDWSMDYHLKVLYQKSKSPSILKIQKYLNKNSFFNTK